jgi:hypothetical protein
MMAAHQEKKRPLGGEFTGASFSTGSDLKDAIKDELRRLLTAH